MNIEPYLSLNGRCEEAMDFYQAALGAQVLFKMRMNESPEPPQPGMVPPGCEHKIMHATVKFGDSTVMMSDGNNDGEPVFKGVTLSLALNDIAEAEKCFAALCDGGQVQLPMAKTFWSPCFGMVADRFGVNWMVTVRV